MSRRHAAEKREVLPDAKFGDTVVSKFMNNLMVDGKKSVAERIVYNAFDRVQSRLKKAPCRVVTPLKSAKFCPMPSSVTGFSPSS